MRHRQYHLSASPMANPLGVIRVQDPLETTSGSDLALRQCEVVVEKLVHHDRREATGGVLH